MVTKRIRPLMCDGKAGTRHRHSAALGLYRRSEERLWAKFAHALCRRRRHRDARISRLSWSISSPSPGRWSYEGARERWRFRIRSGRRSPARRLLAGGSMAFEFECRQLRRNGSRSAALALERAAAGEETDRGGQAHRCVEVHRLQGLPGRMPGMERQSAFAVGFNYGVLRQSRRI